MKISTLLILFSLMLCTQYRAAGQIQPDTAGTSQQIVQQLNNINQAIARLSDSVHALSNSERRLANITNGTIVIDSGALARAQKDPEKEIYAYIITRATATTPQKLRFGICMVLILAFLYTGFRLAYKNALLRDASFNTDGSLRPISQRPFSFSRVQLFWWTLIIISCYFYLFAITGVLVPVNATTAILLGCGVVTCAAGQLIDNRQRQNTPVGLRNQDSNSESQDFFSDILSDDNGISIHRFQALIFNVVFGVAFICFFITAVRNHLYPFIDFSEGQFALIGISSAAYLGLKANENSPASNSGGPTGSSVASAAPNPDVVPDEGMDVNAPAIG